MFPLLLPSCRYSGGTDGFKEECRCRWLEEGPESDAFKNHVAKIRDFSKSTITLNLVIK